ncbi:hypothetical protein SESBI_48056 [Sesbania bispinosa]|nr:hypothetical protein SESBI_48056 [Sesbania bispinosa]
MELEEEDLKAVVVLFSDAEPFPFMALGRPSIEKTKAGRDGWKLDQLDNGGGTTMLGL